jgi:hypothetical protein
MIYALHSDSTTKRANMSYLQFSYLASQGDIQRSNSNCKETKVGTDAMNLKDITLRR